MGQGLGTDPEICIDAFVEAMRATLPDDQHEKLNRPEVRANIAPLGEAVYRIAVDPAQTRADRDTDRAFFDWMRAMSDWADGLERWQNQLVETLASARSFADMRDGIDRLEAPNARRPSAPTHLIGGIR